MRLGERIKAARVAEEMTQEELGALCGTTKQTIFKYEMGIVENIPAARMERLAEHLGVTPAYLMGWSTAAPTAQAKALMDVFEHLDAEDQQKLIDFAAELTANAAKTVSNDSLAVPAQLRAG